MKKVDLLDYLRKQKRNHKLDPDISFGRVPDWCRIGTLKVKDFKLSNPNQKMKIEL